MAFKAAIVLLLMSSMSSKSLPVNISYIVGSRRKAVGARSHEKGGCSSTVMPMSSNHTEVSVHFCHGKHTVVSS
jgi:hypothetical protein